MPSKLHLSSTWYSYNTPEKEVLNVNKILSQSWSSLNPSCTESHGTYPISYWRQQASLKSVTGDSSAWMGCPLNQRLFRSITAFSASSSLRNYRQSRDRKYKTLKLNNMKLYIFKSGIYLAFRPSTYLHINISNKVVPEVVTDVHFFHFPILLFHFCEDLLWGWKKAEELFFFPTIRSITFLRGSNNCLKVATFLHQLFHRLKIKKADKLFVCWAWFDRSSNLVQPSITMEHFSSCFPSTDHLQLNIYQQLLGQIICVIPPPKEKRKKKKKRKYQYKSYLKEFIIVLLHLHVTDGT